MKSKNISSILHWVFALLLFSGGLAAAQSPNPAGQSPSAAAIAPDSSSSPTIPDDALSRGTPRSCMEGFFAAADDKDFDLAARYLNLTALPKDDQATQGPRLARQLWFVLERKADIDFEKLSMEPNGTGKDGLPPNRERLTRIAWAGGFADIDLEQIKSTDGLDVWKVSSGTVSVIPKLYERFRLRIADQFLSEAAIDSLLRNRILGLSGVTWIALSMLLVIWAVLVFGTLKIAWMLIRRMKAGLPARLLRTIYVPIVLLVVTGFMRSQVPERLLSTEVSAIFRAQTLLIVVICWVLFRFADFVSDQARTRLQKGGNTGTHLIDLIRRIAKVMVAIIGLVVWLDNMGYRVTTLLASLGIIGIAVGLASQKFIEDLIAAMTLHATGVVKHNEFIRFGDRQGTLEDIGLRMTRIRSRDRTLITLPNATFASMEIQNYGRRDKILFESQLGLRYETTPDQLRFVLLELRKLLHAHPKVLDEDARVRFVGFGASSLDVAIFCYIDETLLANYLGVTEELNFRIMEIVVRAGASFAFPSQTLYMGRDQAMDETATRHAEAAIRKMREHGQPAQDDFPTGEFEGLSNDTPK